MRKNSLEDRQKYGLPVADIAKIKETLSLFQLVKEAILYGSRAKGNFRAGSDIDLTLIGENINLKLLNAITLAIDDLLLPYSCDLSIYNHIADKDLIDHIARVGISFYKNHSSP